MTKTHTFSGKDGLITESITPIKAIRHKCMECSNFNANEVKVCPIKNCVLYPYRFGKMGKKNFTDEQRKMFSEQMKKIRFKHS